MCLVDDEKMTWRGEDLISMSDDARLDGEAASEFDPCC